MYRLNEISYVLEPINPSVNESPFFPDFFLEPHMLHMEVPRLGVQLELQMPAYTTAMQDPSHFCNLHHSSCQHWILNPLSEARDRTPILMDPSQIHYHWATMGTPKALLSTSLILPFIFTFCIFLSSCLLRTAYFKGLLWGFNEKIYV